MRMKAALRAFCGLAALAFAAPTWAQSPTGPSTPPATTGQTEPYNGQSGAYPGNAPGQTGPYNGQSGAYPGTPGQTGPYNGQSGAYPGTPGQTGPYNGQSGAYPNTPGQTGPYNGQSGAYPNAPGQNGPYNGQGGAYPGGRPYIGQSGADRTGAAGLTDDGQPGTGAGADGSGGSMSSTGAMDPTAPQSGSAVSGHPIGADPSSNGENARAPAVQAAFDDLVQNGGVDSGPANTISAALPTPEFVDRAGSSSLFEIASSQLALQRSQDPKVREFAQQMVEDHTMALNSLRRAVSQTKGANLNRVGGMSQEHQEMLQNLQQAQGQDFDMLYRLYQIKGHKQAVEMFQNYAWNGDKEELRQTVVAATPLLRQHYKMAKSMMDDVAVS